MINRYADDLISFIWSLKNKLTMWQKVELAVIRGRVKLGRVPPKVAEEIASRLEASPIRVGRALTLEKKLNHDNAAAVAERKEKLPKELRGYYHDVITSYDNEEPAFALMLFESVDYISQLLHGLMSVLRFSVDRYQYTIMMGSTHGQHAELQTFGKRCYTWYRICELGRNRLLETRKNLQYSKISGAVGNYPPGIDDRLEREALNILALKPFRGATQIIPRENYLPTAQALVQIVQSIDKIATDFRLMARSPSPIVQEPFGKSQKGSSAMPHKKNTISTEKLEGMSRLAVGYGNMIGQNVKTWEERSIEQSSVERVAWPDLFHVVVHSIKTMTKVIKNMRVYPDRMLEEVMSTRGCYASGPAKDFLVKYGKRFGINDEDAYRIVQLAAFNVFEPNSNAVYMRECPSLSLVDSDHHLRRHWEPVDNNNNNIRTIIRFHGLRFSPDLAMSARRVERWNQSLLKLFQVPNMGDMWLRTFDPSYLLKGEARMIQTFLSKK